jgi:hypothetical protein
MVDIVTRLGAACLAVTFAWAAGYKVLRYPKWRAALEPYRLPTSISATASIIVPLLEVAVVVLLLTGRARAGAALALGLLASFSAALMRARATQGDRLPCGCFGKTQERDYRVLLLRNAGLALAATLVLLGLNGPRASIDLASTDLVPALLVVAGIGLIGWMATQAGSAMRRK